QRGGFGGEKLGQARIVAGASARELRHAERGEAGAGTGRRIGKKLRVRRIGAWPAAFDIVDAELVEGLRNGAFVFDGEVHALRLRPVAQRRVEENDAFLRHRRIPPFRRGVYPWAALRADPGATPSPTRGEGRAASCFPPR